MFDDLITKNPDVKNKSLEKFKKPPISSESIEIPFTLDGKKIGAFYVYDDVVDFITFQSTKKDSYKISIKLLAKYLYKEFKARFP
jgi:hypothetical protein